MSFDQELLTAADLLIQREPGVRGRLAGARIRRAVSTAYYAIFHFILDEATRRVVGTKPGEAKRRRILARSFPHRGLVNTFKKLKAPNLPEDIEQFLEPLSPEAAFQIPPYVREFAAVFVDVQSKRHDADYDLNETLSQNDARVVIRRVRSAIHSWQTADTAADRDLKHMLSILLLLQGKLKGQD